MIEINYSGWFQCRLATDPDPFNDPRGNSGWTFAFPGEPNLDRTIRFQNPIAPRSHGPGIGVTVRTISVNGNRILNHPLLGSALGLLDFAVFEGQDGAIATSTHEPIVPFHVQIMYKDFLLSGYDSIDLTNDAEIKRRQPIAFEANSPDVAQATGITDFALYRGNRKDALQQNLNVETDPVKRSALEGRIQQLVLGGIRATSLGFKLTYQFELRGPNTFTDPSGIIGAIPSNTSTWAVKFWMGAWDSDALSGFTLGTLTIS